MTTFEIISLILSGFTVFAIVFAARQIVINRKQLFLSTITKCVSDFRSLGELNHDTTDTKIIRGYIDLTNEELFYFQHDYIPEIISYEWIDGMLDFIPLTDRDGHIINRDHAIKYLCDNRESMLRNYPRIQQCFEVKGTYDLDLMYSNDPGERLFRAKERKKVIKEILKNVKYFNLYD